MNPSRRNFGKKSAIRHFIINRAYFFVLWPGFHWLAWKFLMVLTAISTWKTWKPLVVFIKLGRREAPRGRSRCAAAAKKAFHEYHLWSRSRIPQVLIFLFSSFMNTTKGFQVFHVEIVVNTIKNFQTSQWNPGHKIKKICAVYNEMTYCWFFAKNAAARVHSYGVIYSLF